MTVTFLTFCVSLLQCKPSGCIVVSTFYHTSLCKKKKKTEIGILKFLELCYAPKGIFAHWDSTGDFSVRRLVTIESRSRSWSLQRPAAAWRRRGSPASRLRESPAKWLGIMSPSRQGPSCRPIFFERKRKNLLYGLKRVTVPTAQRKFCIAK